MSIFFKPNLIFQLHLLNWMIVSLHCVLILVTLLFIQLNPFLCFFYHGSLFFFVSVYSFVHHFFLSFISVFLFFTYLQETSLSLFGHLAYRPTLSQSLSLSLYIYLSLSLSIFVSSLCHSIFVCLSFFFEFLPLFGIQSFRTNLFVAAKLTSFETKTLILASIGSNKSPKYERKKERKESWRKTEEKNKKHLHQHNLETILQKYFRVKVDSMLEFNQ